MGFRVQTRPHHNSGAVPSKWSDLLPLRLSKGEAEPDCEDHDSLIWSVATKPHRLGVLADYPTSGIWDNQDAALLSLLNLGGSEER